MRLVIFDCDGVLIDSEPVSQKLVQDEAASLGWAMTDADIYGLTGQTWSALKPVFEAKIGHALPANWPKMLQDRLIEVMRAGVSAIPGARATLEATASLGLPYRIASNSSHEEMDQKFGFTRLRKLVEGRTHSARDVPRGKPDPDVFLAAAAAEGVAPDECLVVEDSLPGVTAARAAGMRVIAYAPHGWPTDLPIQPDMSVTSLADLPALFRASMRIAA